MPFGIRTDSPRSSSLEFDHSNSVLAVELNIRANGQKQDDMKWLSLFIIPRSMKYMNLVHLTVCTPVGSAQSSFVPPLHELAFDKKAFQSVHTVLSVLVRCGWPSSQSIGLVYDVLGHIRPQVPPPSATR